ncbi:hypothetical protein G9A89_011092 [Geosiphon pyriformis]|nr:hypothetical protein G9A89_011092 [Geosiphon pyriformis]
MFKTNTRPDRLLADNWEIERRSKNGPALFASPSVHEQNHGSSINCAVVTKLSSKSHFFACDLSVLPASYDLDKLIENLPAKSREYKKASSLLALLRLNDFVV